MFRGSTKPVSANPSLIPDTRCGLASGEVTQRNPITGIAGCCARAASGLAAPTLPSSVMNSRRFMTDPLLILRDPDSADYHTVQMRAPCLHAGHSVLVSLDGTSVLLFCRFSGVGALYPRLPGPPSENLHTNRHRPVLRTTDLM